MIHQDIDLAEFQSLGNFSKNIDKAILQRGLLNCEISILQRWMGLKATAEFDDYSEDIKQLIYRALALLASAWVMKNNVFVSRGGAVEKRDAEVSRNLTSAELNTQVSQFRLEARELMEQAEQMAYAEGHTSYEWRREVNILNLWSLSFGTDSEQQSSMQAIEVAEQGVFDSTFDVTFQPATSKSTTIFDTTFDKSFN